MNKSIKKLINKRRINLSYLSSSVLIYPELKSRLNISKAAAVLIAMALTAVTLTSNVSAATEDTGDVSPAFRILLLNRSASLMFLAGPALNPLIVPDLYITA